jgi:hypothetical protein
MRSNNAKDVSKLGIDWKTVYSPENCAKSDLYLRVLLQLNALRVEYDVDGYFKPRDEPS